MSGFDAAGQRRAQPLCNHLQPRRTQRERSPIRLARYAAYSPQPPGAILEAVLYRGELPRGDAAGIVGTGDRQARRVVSALIERGVLLSDSRRAPMRLAFPATLASRWMPGLCPDRTG
jgi:hypothetical protein